MKKSVIVSVSLAAAALAVLSCAKQSDINEIVKDPSASNGVTIRVLSGDDATRTVVVDGDVPTVEWVETDNVSVFEVVDGVVKGVAQSENAVIADGKASFVTQLAWDDAEGGSYQYSAVYPASSVVEYDGNYYIILPDYQSLEGNNFSVDSDILFSTPLDHGAARVEDGEDVMFTFRRLGTVVRLTLNGIPAGEKISQVTLTAPVNIAGAIIYDPVTSTVDGESAFAVSASKTVTLGLDALVATGNDVVWFRVMSERDWAAGEAMTLKVLTDKGVYQKEVTLPSDIRFPDGGLTKFGVGLGSSKVQPLTVPCLWDFEDGADDWTFIDNDGDGNNWFPYYLGGVSGDYSLVSLSYSSGALYPDDWAFTPPVQLTDVNYLSFWVAAYDLNWPAEHYAVYIAKDSPMGALTVLMPETIYPNGGFYELSDDGAFQRFVYRIPDEFADQVVCFGFRHFNCSDQVALLLDDVEITVTPPVSTIVYEDYLGDWSYNNTIYFTVSPKEEGISYSISGFPGQGEYELEARFENQSLVLYDQVAAVNGGLTSVFQGLYYVADEEYYSWHDFYESDPRVLFRAALYDDNLIRIVPDNSYVGYIWVDYIGQEYDDYGDYSFSLPDVLEKFVPDETNYLFFDNFENGIGGWTLFDIDGDGYNWEIPSAGFKCHSGSYVLSSESYVNNIGALHPDNWAFTPAVQLTQDNYLSFWVTAQDPNWKAEHYAVYITDVAPTADNLASCTVLLPEQEFPNGTPVETGDNDYQRYVIQIPSSFNGKAVYVGFRHFNCTDMYRFNLDDVGISEGEPVIATDPAPAPVQRVPALKKGARKEAPKALRVSSRKNSDFFRK